MKEGSETYWERLDGNEKQWPYDENSAHQGQAICFSSFLSIVFVLFFLRGFFPQTAPLE